jgi:hypothetical protein
MALTKPRAYQIFDIDYKQSVRVISLSNVTLSGGAPNQVDGVNLSLNDRILVAGQSSTAQNGLYYVTTLGSGSNGTWTRSVDGNQTGEIESGLIVMVTEGLIWADTSWKLITNDPITIGVTGLVFEQNTGNAFGNINANGTSIISNAASGILNLTAGNNISITGNNTSKTITIDVTGISLNSISNGTSNVNVVSSGGNVTVGVAGTSNVAVFSSSGQNVTGFLTASGNITGSNIIANGRPLTSLSASNIDTGTLAQARLANASLTVNGTSIALGGSATITANTTNALTIGTGLGGTSFNGGTAVTITNTGVLSLANGGGITASASTGAITLGSTATSANTASAIVARDASGNFSAGTITATLNGAATTAGTVTTAAQPNITSVGTLSSLSVTGNITGGNILGNGAGLTGINAFSNISVTGGNSAVADSISDTLTLTAGSGITLVMDSGTDTLTIAASAGSEIFVDGADFGTVTETVTASDDLGLVTEAVTAQSDLGTIVISGLIYPDQFVLPSYTTTTLPTASVVGAMIYVTNESGGAVPAFSDGTNWRRVTDRAIVS